MSFKQRLMKATFVLGKGTFGKSGENQTTVGGLRMSARIRRAGGPGKCTCSLEVYGMKLDDMNKLSTLGMVATTQRRNTVTIEAGDEDGYTTVFQGVIMNAYPDFNGMPDVPFRVEGQTGLGDAIAPADPRSYPNGAAVSDILSSIANKLGAPFENNGVTTKLSEGSYYYGSLYNQALNVVQDAGISWNCLDDGTLAIWNPGESRGGKAPLISPESGLVGYPSFSSNGIALRTIYNPSIGFGKKIVVQSSLQAACGTWSVYDLNHSLDCLIPHGSWFSDLQAAPLGLGPFVP